jgi:hypothetical protein
MSLTSFMDTVSESFAATLPILQLLQDRRRRLLYTITGILLVDRWWNDVRLCSSFFYETKSEVQNEMRSRRAARRRAYRTGSTDNQSFTDARLASQDQEFLERRHNTRSQTKSRDSAKLGYITRVASTR